MARLRTTLTSFLLRKFKRREWTVNRMDPTLVVQWKGPGLVMLSSWGIVAKATAFGHTWSIHDSRFFTWLFDILEDANDEREAEFEDDPMGRLADYV